MPNEKSLVTLLAVVQAPDRSRVRDHPAVLFPRLMFMDVSEHERLRLGAEERSGRELMIEARHRYAVFGHASVHGAVRHADRRHTGRARGFVDRGKTAKERR